MRFSFFKRARPDIEPALDHRDHDGERAGGGAAFDAPATRDGDPRDGDTRDTSGAATSVRLTLESATSDFQTRNRHDSATNGSLANDLRLAEIDPAVRLSRVSVFAVANQKGGVGKTTTAVNLAACMAESGGETLLIDIDPQANATVGLGMAKDLAPSVYDVLCGNCTAAEAVHETRFPGLFLMPAGAGLAGANVELPRQERPEQRVREAIAPLRERFPFVLLDCPPSLGPLTVTALVAADRLLVPVQTEYYALEGLAQLLDSVGLIQRELNPTLTVAGMLLTMHDSRTRLGRDVEREVREHFPNLVFDTVIPRNVRISEAPSYGVPITRHDPHCAGSIAYMALAREVTARSGQTKSTQEGAV